MAVVRGGRVVEIEGHLDVFTSATLSESTVALVTVGRSWEKVK